MGTAKYPHTPVWLPGTAWDPQSHTGSRSAGLPLLGTVTGSLGRGTEGRAHRRDPSVHFWKGVRFQSRARVAPHSRTGFRGNLSAVSPATRNLIRAARGSLSAPAKAEGSSAQQPSLAGPAWPPLDQRRADSSAGAEATRQGSAQTPSRSGLPLVAPSAWGTLRGLSGEPVSLSPAKQGVQDSARSASRVLCRSPLGEEGHGAFAERRHLVRHERRCSRPPTPSQTGEDTAPYPVFRAVSSPPLPVWAF